MSMPKMTLQAKAASREKKKSEKQAHVSQARLERIFEQVRYGPGW
jgi:hypothetical protein